MIVKLDNTEIVCQSIIKAYDMQNDRFNIVLTINEKSPDDDVYVKLLKDSRVLTMTTGDSNKEYLIVNRDIMYNVRYDNDTSSQITISIPVREQ